MINICVYSPCFCSVEPPPSHASNLQSKHTLDGWFKILDSPDHWWKFISPPVSSLVSSLIFLLALKLAGNQTISQNDTFSVSWKLFNIYRINCIYYPCQTCYIHPSSFDIRFFDFSLGSFGALYKIFDVTIFKWLLLPQVLSNFNQALRKVWQSGENAFIRLLNVLALCQIKKNAR